MKTRLWHLLLLVALCCGCTHQRAFDSLRTYLESHPPSGSLDAATVFAHWKPVVDRKDFGVPFLLKQSQSSNTAVAITAYLALEELVGQVKMTPTPAGDKVVSGIGPDSLAQRFSSFPTNGVAQVWLAWYQMAHEQMMKHLEPGTPGYQR